ncbi:MAG: hypothetical protein KZY61_00930 [Clostridiaceae bacterium]|nr:hypothetical protein [Clostridiaceae bacterium]MBW4860334.1 hypothetical protein [Clostridiaceae bacterium]MBW4867219.1 hypothetical protein [Clostridiaceae bacterium]
MKKILMLILCVFLLTACGNESKGDVNVGSNQEENDNGSTHKIDNKKKLGITIEDVIKVESIQNKIDEYSNVKTYETDDVKIDIIDRSGLLYLYMYTFENDKYPSVVVAKTNAVEIVNKEAVEVMSDIAALLDEDVNPFAKIVPGVDEEDCITIGIVFNEEHDITDLPIFYSDIAINDFFLNENNIEFFNESLSQAKYKELYERANLHIKENNIKGHDSAYDIMNILEPVKDLMENVDVQYDDFDNESTIHYKGLNDISNNNYIVPFISTKDNKMNLLIGFEKDGWLFSKEIYFNIDGEKKLYGTLNFDRNTLGGSRIREEYIDTNCDEELIENIINADEISMRFEGKKGDLDYTLTDTDIKAIETIKSFNGIKNDLSNLLYHFKNN